MKPFAFLALLLIAACGSRIEPEAVEQTSNASVQVEKLFDNDGCTVYRFMDRGYTHYYTSCGKATTTIGAHGEARPCPGNPKQTCLETVYENIGTR